MTLATLAARYCATLDDSANDILGRFNGSYQGGMGTVADVSHGGTRAYVFDGANDRIEVADIFKRGYLPAADEPFSVALWVKATDPSASHTWAGNYNSSGSGWSIGTYNNLIYAGMYSTDSGYSSLRVTVPYSSTAWKHIVFTYDGSGNVGGIKIYIDGALATMTDASESSYVKLGGMSGAMNIGARSSSHRFAGRMDDVMVFNDVIGVEEAAEIAGANPGALTSDVFFATSFENDDHGFSVNAGNDPDLLGWYRSNESGHNHEGSYGLSAKITSGGKQTVKTITLPRPGTLSFWWRAQSGATANMLVDYVTKMADPSTAWVKESVRLDAGERRLSWSGILTGEYPSSVSIDDIRIVLDPPAPVVLEFGTDRGNLTKGSTGSFTLTRSGGDLSESLTVSLESDDTNIATVPATVTFTAAEATASVVVTSAGQSGSATITASYAPDSASDSLTAAVVTEPTTRLSLQASTDRQTILARSAKYSLDTSVTRQTFRSSYRASSTKLIVRNARTRGDTVVSLTWSAAAGSLPSLHRSLLVVQLQLAAALIEPIVSAADSVTGENIPVMIRNRIPELPATTDRLKLVLQPPRGTSPNGITITISDYTNN